MVGCCRASGWFSRPARNTRAAFLVGTVLAVATGQGWAADSTMVGGQFALHGIVTHTVGPNGGIGQAADVLTFSNDEVKKIAAGHHSAALLFQTSSDWANAVTAGAEDELRSLGIAVAGLSNSNYSASDQAHAVQTILAKKPSGIIVWPVNPDELRPALQKAGSQGVKLALISNMPSGFQQGRDYVGLVGDDLHSMGQKTAAGLAAAIGGAGDIGYLYFDANAYVVNQRDAAFRTTIERDFPKIKIAATQGFSDPQRAFQIASAMILQHPALKAIYVPWAEPAAGVLQALRAAHRTDIAVATMDLSNTVAVSLAQNGAIKALVIDDPYSIGKSLAAEIGYSLINKPVPPYIQVPAVPVARANLLEAYAQSYHAKPPPEVTQAMGQ